MTDKPQKQNPLAAIAGIGGAIGGWALVKYSGGSLLIPAAAAILLLIIFTKTSVRPPYFRGAIAVATAHVVWFVVAALILGTWTPVILDIVALTIGVIWLWVRPSLGPVIFVAVVELISSAMNAITLSSVEVGSAAHRALVVHLLLRMIVVACLALGYRRFKRERERPPEWQSTTTANA